MSLVTEFAQHLMCAVPNAGAYVEYSIEGAGYYPWQYDLRTTRRSWCATGCRRPQRAGLGRRGRPAWLRAAEHRRTAV